VKHAAHHPSGRYRTHRRQQNSSGEQSLSPAAGGARSRYNRGNSRSSTTLCTLPLIRAGETTPSRAIVQSAGHAYWLIGQELKEGCHRNGPMQLLLLRYTQALLTQMAQTAVCNRHHSLDPQLRLGQMCCECYAVVKKETDRLLPRANPNPPPEARVI
jgi:hypothetical protein